jgi:hypothetical protein
VLEGAIIDINSSFLNYSILIKMNDFDCWRKSNLCWDYGHNKCPKSKHDCPYAHGNEDILSPNHSCKTHRCPNRSSKSPESPKKSSNNNSNTGEPQAELDRLRSENKNQRKEIKTLKLQASKLETRVADVQNGSMYFLGAGSEPESELESESELELESESDRNKKMKDILKLATKVSIANIQQCKTLEATNSSLVADNTKLLKINKILQGIIDNQYCDDFQPGLNKNQSGM